MRGHSLDVYKKSRVIWGAICKDNGNLQQLLWECSLDRARLVAWQEATPAPQVRTEPPVTPQTCAVTICEAAAQTEQATHPDAILGDSDARNGIKYHCSDCKFIDKCKSTFNKSWNDKSRHGLGCPRHPWENLL